MPDDVEEIDFKQRSGKFLDHLRKLREDADTDSDARRDLALLRRGLRGTDADRYRMTRIIAPYLLNQEDPQDWLFFLVGSLFALYPDESVGKSLGWALGALKEDSNGAETRLMSLLPSRLQDIDKPLRGIISLLSSKKNSDGSQASLDYLILLNNLSQWNNSKRHIQNRWARDFYRRVNDLPDAENKSIDSTDQEEDTNE